MEALLHDAQHRKAGASGVCGINWGEQSRKALQPTEMEPRNAYDNATMETLTDGVVNQSGFGRQCQFDPETGFSKASLGFSHEKDPQAPASRPDLLRNF